MMAGSVAARGPALRVSGHGRSQQGFALFLVFLFLVSFAPFEARYAVGIIACLALLFSAPALLRYLLSMFAPLLGIVALGYLSWLVGISTFFESADIWPVLRDFSHGTGAITFFCLGGMLALWRVRHSQIFWAVVIAALVAGLAYIFRFYTETADLSTIQRAFIRARIGTGYFVCIFLFILYTRHFAELRRKNLLLIGAACCAIGLFSIYLSTSRSFLQYVLVAMVILFVPREALTRTPSLALVLLLLGEVAVTTPLLLNFFDPRSVQAFIDSMPISIREVFPRLYFNFGNINDFWRGYETQRTFNDVLASPAYQIIFGKGLGATANMGVYMDLGLGLRKEIGTFHNGFSWLALKTGVVGIALYIWQCQRLYQAVLSTVGKPGSYYFRVALGLIVTCAIATPAISGLINPTNDMIDVAMVILGYHLATVFLASRGRAIGSQKAVQAEQVH